MDKNTKLAFFLIALVIILFPYFMPKKAEVAQEEKPFQDEKVLEVIAEEQVENPISISETIVSELKVDSSLVDVYTQPAEKNITIETDLYKAVVSTNGGVIKSWKIKK